MHTEWLVGIIGLRAWEDLLLLSPRHSGFTFTSSYNLPGRRHSDHFVYSLVRRFLVIFSAEEPPSSAIPSANLNLLLRQTHLRVSRGPVVLPQPWGGNPEKKTL